MTNSLKQQRTPLVGILALALLVGTTPIFSTSITNVPKRKVDFALLPLSPATKVGQSLAVTKQRSDEQTSVNLPGSPAGLFLPDRFQFYTLDKSGEVVTKQMTRQEIQSLIAAGGGHLPAMATISTEHQPQKAGEVPTSGTKVADVVQNVQNVLKGELSKPVPTIIAPLPTIPGHANSEWSNILPSILATGDAQIDTQQDVIEKIPLSPPAGSSQYDEITERPMIQVPVITVEEKLPMQNDSSLNSQITHNTTQNKTKNEPNEPIFQILNTISADRLKNHNNNNNNKTLAEQNGPAIEEPLGQYAPSIVPEMHPMSEKIGGKDQVKLETDTYPDDNNKGELWMDLGLVKPILLNNILLNENISSTGFPHPVTENSLQSTQNDFAIIKTAGDELVTSVQIVNQNDEEQSPAVALSPQTQATALVTSLANTSTVTSTTENSTVSGELLSELTHSLSSMISQISQSIAEPVPFKQTNSNDNVNSSLSSNDGSTGVQGIVATDGVETPIVRIDIMEVKPHLTSDTNSLNFMNSSHNSNDESPVVRIQLATDTTSEINHLIESFTSNKNGNEHYPINLPEIAPLDLPSRHNIHANNVTSGLIAGFTNNNKNNDNNTINTKDISIQEDFVQLPDDQENGWMDSIEQNPLNDEKYNITNMMMQKISFDQLPIIKRQKIRQPSNASLFTIRENENDVGEFGHNQSSISTFQRENQKDEQNSFQISHINNNNNNNNNSNDDNNEKVDFSTEISASHILIPSKIQLDDLPIVEKVNKPIGIKINNFTSNKSNITDHYEIHNENTPNKISLMTNLYQNDPYKKLGEIMTPLVKLDGKNISAQSLSYNNKTFKIKDQKKDSSMEKNSLVPSLIYLEEKNALNTSKDSAHNESSIFTGIKPPARKPDTTLTISSGSIRDDYKSSNNKNSSEQIQKWTLIPQQSAHNTVPKIGAGAHIKRPIDVEAVTQSTPVKTQEQQQQQQQQPPPSQTVALLNHSRTVDGLDSSVKSLEPDIRYFSNICNDLAFSLWNATNEGLSVMRSLVISPFGITSMLAMVFLGARGTTSDQMNNILKLDDVASFNPHLIFQNVTDSVGLARKQGVANAAFVRELFADKIKVRKLLPFYKEQAQQFYDGVVAEVNFATISDLARRRTNLMIRKQTGGRIKDFARANIVPLRSPLAALSANVYQTDCNSSDASSDGRDGELYFAVSPAVRQRKLIPVPSTVWRSGVLAGYEPSLDATAIALGGPDKLVSTIFIIPGQQGFTAPGDNLELLEQRLVRRATYDGLWNKLLKVIIPRPEFELQVPKFSHRSVINATAALKRMGLQQLFDNDADLKGINGIGSDLYLTDVLQMNLFSTCGDENILSGRHHVEFYPTNSPRDVRTVVHQLNKISLNKKDKISDQFSTLKHTTTKMNQDSDKPRLKLDRPFLYFVRHNPTGLILHMGRFNPRLLP